MNISEVILKTSSISRTKLFYHKTLELPVIEEGPGFVKFGAGASALSFELAADMKPYYHLAFNITNNKFSDSYEWLNSKLDILTMETGLPIASYPDWNAESFYFYDNNGSILEFIVRFDLPYHSGEQFSVNDIREISEVGVVTPNVLQTSDSLREKGFSYFTKSKPSENFTVLGDDHGLLIITSAGRNWVPTHKPAQIFPMTIVADDVTLHL